MPRSIIPEAQSQAQDQNSIQEAAAIEKPKGETAILTASEILTLLLVPKHIWNTRRTLNP